MNKTHYECRSLKAYPIILFSLLLSVLWQTSAWAVQNAASYTSATRYNLAGQVTGTIRPANVHVNSSGSTATNYPAIRNTYSSSTGLLTKVEIGALSNWQNETVDPSSWSGFSVQSRVDYTYDSRGRKSTEKHVSGSTTTLTHYSYDIYDRLTCKAVRMNPSNYNSLPSSACSLGGQGSFGADRITQYTYQQPTNTTTNTTANFDLITHERRAVGTSLEQVYRKNDYDNLGRLEYVTDANNNKAGMTYDDRSRLYRWYFPNKTNPGLASTTDYEQYGYDNNSNRTSLRKRDGRTIGYQYDQLNRVIKKDIPNSTSLDVYYDYDLRGLELHARFGSDSGAGITRTFDGHGRPLTASDNTSGTTRTLTYEHDNNSNRTKLTYPDNKSIAYDFDGINRLDLVALPDNASTIDYSFDSFARPKEIERSGGAVTTLAYDGLSRLSQLQQSLSGSNYDVTFDYGYSPASQMTQQDISSGRYHYDLDGKKGLNQGYNVNGLNQYTSVGGTSHGYDDNGNLTSDGSTTYTYDVENRLIKAQGAKNADLTYDPLGRLSKIVSGGQTTSFLYDGDALVTEYTGSAMSKRYVHAVEVDHPIAEYSGSNTTTSNVSYLHRNHQGSIIAASSGSGSGQYSKSYDAFGQMEGSTQGRFAYTGQIWLPEIGLYHYKARAYNPKLGRFMQIDPVGYDDQMNLYAYVGNDPLNANDPSGKYADLVIEAASLSVGVTSLANNVANGNYGAAAVDGVGVILDGILAVVPLAPGAVGLSIQASRAGSNATGVVANGIRGRTSEARVLDELGLPKNNTKVITSEGSAIPDALTGRKSIEIKDCIGVSCTKQIRIQTGAARASGRESVLVTGSNTRVSGPAERAFDRILRRDDLGPNGK